MLNESIEGQYYNERYMANIDLINDLGEEFLSSLNFETIVKRVLGKIRGLLNCEAGSVILYDETRKKLVFLSVSGSGEKVIEGMDIPYGRGIAWWSFLNGKEVIVNDVSNDPRFYPEIDKITGTKTENLICVPVVKGKRKLGVIEGVNKINGDFNDIDLDILKMISKFAALSLDNSIAHKLLNDKNKELKEMNRYLQEFVNIVSHDLQTPLTSIKGYVDLILDRLCGENIDTNVYMYLNRIENNIVYIMSFTRELLEFAKLKRTDLFPTLFNPGLLLDEVIISYEKQLIQRGIRMELNVNAGDIYFDRDLMFALLKIIFRGCLNQNIESIIVNIKEEPEGCTRFVVKTKPDAQFSDVWMSNILEIELHYLKNIFSILDGCIKEFTKSPFNVEFSVPNAQFK